jgi:hypothetical protein
VCGGGGLKNNRQGRLEVFHSGALAVNGSGAVVLRVWSANNKWVLNAKFCYFFVTEDLALLVQSKQCKNGVGM